MPDPKCWIATSTEKIGEEEARLKRERRPGVITFRELDGTFREVPLP